MKNGYKVFDADLHVIEPADLWTKRIDRKYKDKAPEGYDRFPQDVFMRYLGKDLPAFSEQQVASIKEKKLKKAHIYESMAKRGYDGASQVDAMDDEGIDAAVQFPTRGLYAIGPAQMELGLAVAIARAYNDWISEFCSVNTKRMRGAAMLPAHDATAAAEEAERAVKELGCVAAFLRPNPVGDYYWHHPHYDPLWKTLQDLDIPLCFHEGGPGSMRGIVNQIGGDRFETIRMAHTLSHPGEMMHAMVSMCMGGVLEKFPRLKVAFLEANCSWAPWLLWRMDEHCEVAPNEGKPELPMMPSEYFKRQCYVSVECDESIAADLLRGWEGRNVVFSTDYPHTDSKFPRATEYLLNHFELEKNTMQRILWDNCAQLYRVETW